jgi:hypothetical protein
MSKKRISPQSLTKWSSFYMFTFLSGIAAGVAELNSRCLQRLYAGVTQG